MANAQNVEVSYPYDVAISFMAIDETLANEIFELLSPRLRTFVYSKRQEQLAGRDGDEAFRDVFLRQARIVVILFRNGWGETPFTLIEQEALRDRAHNEGWRFSLFVAVEERPNMPAWLSERKLYYGLPRFGIAGLAGAVESLFVEAGGESSPDTVAERAARADRQIQFESDRASFFRSDAGVRAADQEFDAIADEILSIAGAVAANNKNLPLSGEKRRTVYGESSVYVQGPRRCLSVVWHREYANDLEHSYLELCIWQGSAPLYGQMYIEHPRKEFQTRYSFDVDRSMSLHTCAADNKRLITRSEFAAACIDILMNAVLEERRSRQ
jgi:hypothetical protein